jgi:sigma54-dependent transcription regulator
MTNLIRYRVELMYYPCNNQLMDTIRSVKCSIVHDDFDVSCNPIKYENKLIHEHDFVQAAKGVDDSLICCITCGSHYCSICGKLLENEVTPSVLASEGAILVGE